MVARMINLTGKAQLFTGELPITPPVSDAEGLKMRLDLDYVFLQAINIRPDIAHNNYRSYYTFKDGLFHGGVIIPTIEGPCISVSINPPNKNGISLYVPDGFLKRNLFPLLDDPDILTLSIKNAEWFAATLNSLDSENKIKYRLTQHGSVILDGEYEKVYNSLLKEQNVLVDWDKIKKSLTIDFIYSEGVVDSGKLALYIYDIVVGSNLPKSLTNFL